MSLNPSSARRIHPLIRLMMFLVFAILMSRANLSQLVFSAGLLMTWMAISKGSRAGIRKRLFRLRWLFLSIVMVYAFMTPGRSIIPAGGSIWPTVEGVSGGLHQCLVLGLIVMAVHLLLYYCTRDELLQGIRGFLAPLAGVGVPHERIAMRITLVFDVLSDVQTIVEHQLRQLKGRRLSRTSLGQFAVNLFEQTEAGASRHPSGEIRVSQVSYPPLWQWCLPVLVVGLLWAAGLPFRF